MNEPGDAVRIYRNANSVNAMAAEGGGGDPEWFLSLEMLRWEETFGIGLYSVFTIAIATGLVVYIKKIGKDRKKETV